jgi:MSHA biogenesis protein MshP
MAALFIIVTLAAIGVYLLTISTGQVAAATQDEQAARAYQAARVGIEVAAYQLLRTAGCPASQTIALQQGLLGFWTKVDCASVSTESEAGSTVSVFLLTATGCNRNACGPVNTDATYVERQLQLTLSR